MKKILAVCLLLFIGLVFSATNTEDTLLRTMDDDTRDADSIDDSTVDDDSAIRDSDSDTMMEDDTRDEGDRRERKDEMMDRATDRRDNSTAEDRKRKLDTLREHRDTILSHCESAEGDKAEACRKRLAIADRIKCDNITDTDAFNVCSRSVRKAAENRCEDLEGDDKALCLRKVEAYGKEYVARERHELNERCRELNGTERADCEREINTEFKEHMRERYQEWKNNTMTDEEKRRIRENVLSHHKQKVEELKNRTSEKKAKLLERLDHAIDKAQRKVEKMETLIERISSKGYDVTELKYLLEEYQNSLDDAQIYYDEEQYRDALASLKEAFRYFHEFKQTVRKILSAHREGRPYVASEEPFVDEETDEGETPDDEIPPLEVVE
ncbi:MAG TPA: hypothetical protein VI912_05600 [Candidatus Bilamarchaeaceae archaeon]|nr:hypothetical protein [Candidatus Bilamarchaeaceae archaeon]